MHAYFQSAGLGRLAGRIDSGRPNESFVWQPKQADWSRSVWCVCAAGRRALTLFTAHLHNVHKSTYKMYACMHARTHVRDAGMWIE